MGDRAVHRGRPAAPDRPRAQDLRRASASQVEDDRPSTSPASTRTSTGTARPADQAAGRVRGVRQAACGLEAHRRDRRGLADRRDLRQGRRQRGPLRADAAGVPAHASATAAGGAWADFRSKNDPEAPTTVLKRASRTRRPRRSPRAGWRCPTRARCASRRSPAGADVAAASTRATDPPPAPPVPTTSIGSQLLRAFRAGPPHASNWELVAARHSATGHAIGGAGPAGRLLRPADPDGGGPPRPGHRRPRRRRSRASTSTSSSATGATTPGAPPPRPPTTSTPSPRSSARTTCTTSTRASAWRWRSSTATNSWTPQRGDQTPPGSETLTAYRTVHGIVYARGTVGGQKVAFVSARTTYFHEADSALGFIQLNDPNFVTGPQRFQQAASNINFGFNWAYIDADHIAYYQSGWYPQRAAGTSPDFPILGTGRVRLEGLRPGPAHARRPSRSTAARTRSTPTTWSPGTTSRRPAGRPPTTSTPSARSTARR